MIDAVSDDMLDAIGVAGTAEHVRAGIARRARDFDHVALYFPELHHDHRARAGRTRSTSCKSARSRPQREAETRYRRLIARRCLANRHRSVMAHRWFRGIPT
jgi:hypothetical protein